MTANKEHEEHEDDQDVEDVPQGVHHVIEHSLGRGSAVRAGPGSGPGRVPAGLKPGGPHGPDGRAGGAGRGGVGRA